MDKKWHFYTHVKGLERAVSMDGETCEESE